MTSFCPWTTILGCGGHHHPWWRQQQQGQPHNKHNSGGSGSSSTRNNNNNNDDDDDDGTDGITWMDLLSARGNDLWKLRAQLIVSTNDGVGGNHHHHDYALPVEDTKNNKNPLQRQRQQQQQQRRGGGCVYVFGSTHAFLDAEQKFGMDKEERGTAQAAQALTQTVEDEWKRQRAILVQADGGPLQNILEQSKTAASFVSWRHILLNNSRNNNNSNNNNSKNNNSSNNSSSHPMVIELEVDLVNAVREAIGEWIVRLFQGQDNNDENCNVVTAFVTYWNRIRCSGATTMTTATMEPATTTAKIQLGQALKWNNGLCRSFSCSGGYANQEEVLENVIHAMTAASDAANCLVFWTLVQLSSHQNKELYDMCRDEIQRDTNNIVFEQDLQYLAQFKKMATQGTEPISPTKIIAPMSTLARCLVETVRVFPPVWTLPRSNTWNHHRHRSSNNYYYRAYKLDVITINQAVCHDPTKEWNPNHDWNQYPDYYIASFGVGKRACPAGTAALWAAFSLLRQFILLLAYRRRSLDEMQTGKALQSAYLGPTLAAQGPQWFRLLLDGDNNNNNHHHFEDNDASTP